MKRLEKKIKRAAIIQPNFFPWIGYYEIIKFVDIFLVLDDTQYTRRDWRNKNFINNNGKKLNVTIPVQTKNRYFQKINETQIAGSNWTKEILKKISHCYKKTKYYEEIFNFIKSILNEKEKYLYNVSLSTIFEIMQFLQIEKDLLLTSNVGIDPKFEKNERIIKICKVMGVTNYVTGPSALNYLKPNIFINNKITLEILEYKKQINYLNNNNFSFLEKLSIIDLLFHRGKFSKNFLQIPNVKTFTI
tara:strand:+ start:5580 stop:6317 length:738 start_codon:yes stop_codon:yes gene_type:complete